MITIRELSECPEVIPTLVQWFTEGFGPKAIDPDYETTWLNNSLLTKNKLPRTWVAFIDDVPVGTNRFYHLEMLDRPQYDPWWGYAYVVHEHRSSGVFRALSSVVVRYAISCGIKFVYASAAIDNEGWVNYGLDRGFQVVEEREFLGIPQKIAVADIDAIAAVFAKQGHK